MKSSHLRIVGPLPCRESTSGSCASKKSISGEIGVALSRSVPFPSVATKAFATFNRSVEAAKEGVTNTRLPMKGEERLVP